MKKLFGSTLKKAVTELLKSNAPSVQVFTAIGANGINASTIAVQVGQHFTIKNPFQENSFHNFQGNINDLELLLQRAADGRKIKMNNYEIIHN
jgi:hypothetical protein